MLVENKPRRSRPTRGPHTKKKKNRTRWQARQSKAKNTTNVSPLITVHQSHSFTTSAGANKQTVFPNPARQHVRPLTSGPTRVKGSRGVSLVSCARAENAEAIGWSTASGDALMRASEGSNVHASHRSSDATLRPQSRCVRAGTGPTHDAPSTLLAPESGGLRERRRRPTTLDPVTSHVPRSHTVSATQATTSERQRAGICGISGGPNGASDLLSGTTSLSDAAARRRESFSDARRDRTPWPDIGKDVLSSDIEA